MTGPSRVLRGVPLVGWRLKQVPCDLEGMLQSGWLLDFGLKGLLQCILLCLESSRN